MDRVTALTLSLALMLGACSGEGDAGGALPSPEPSLPIATVLLDNGEESKLVTVDVAETPDQHELGLTGKESLPPDEGIAFVFLEGRSAGIAVNGAPVPLSVAFFDARGTILDIAACNGTPCRLPGPGREYMGALALNEGSFDEWEIAEGDHVQLTR